MTVQNRYISKSFIIESAQKQNKYLYTVYTRT